VAPISVSAGSFEVLDRSPSILGEMVGEVLEGASGRQLFADLRDRRIDGMTSTVSDAREAPVTRGRSVIVSLTIAWVV